MAKELEKEQPDSTEPQDELETEAAESQNELEEEVEEQEPSLKDRISVAVEDVGLLRKQLKVTVPREAIDERLTRSYEELRHEAAVPGFRKGRAPMELIRKRFGKEVSDDVRAAIITEAYEAALEKEQLEVLGEPDIDLDKIELPDEGDLEFACEVEVKPEFDLPSLKGIEIRQPKIEVTAEDIDREVERLRMLAGRFEVVEDGVKADDLVTADLVVTVDGEQITSQSDVGLFARPRAIEGMVFEDLAERLAGAKAGQQRTLEGTLPDDYEREDLRGKRAEVQITVKEVKRLVLPELNEQFLSDYGFESEEELRNSIREGLEARLGDRVRSARREQVRQYLLENVKLDLPEKLSNRQAARVAARRILQMRSQGVPDTEIEKRMDELQTQARQQAANDLKLFFIMEKIAEQLDVSVSEEELNGRIAAIAQAYGRRFDRVRDEMIRDGSFSALYLELRDEKCIDKILETAKIIEESASPEESADSADRSKEESVADDAT